MNNRHDEYLAANGWREWPTQSWELHDRTWYRRVKTLTPCQLNRDKPGIQVAIKQWDYSKFPAANGHVGYQLELQGDCMDGHGIRLIASIGDNELPEVLDSQVEKLRRIWEAAQLV